MWSKFPFSHYFAGYRYNSAAATAQAQPVMSLFIVYLFFRDPPERNATQTVRVMENGYGWKTCMSLVHIYRFSTYVKFSYF